MTRPVPTACPDCRAALGSDPVFCAVCGTPAHRECFDERGVCSVRGCTGLRYRNDPRGKPVNLVASRGSDGRPVPRTYSVDFTSTRESVLLTLGLVVLVFGGAFMVLPRAPHGSSWSGTIPWSIFGVGLVLCAIRAGISDYRVFDGKERVLWLYQVTFGHTRRTRLASFDRCRAVVLVGRRASRRKKVSKHRSITIWGRQWWVAVELDGGRPIAVTDRQFVDDPGQGTSGSGAAPIDLRETSQTVARLIGVEVREHTP